MQLQRNNPSTDSPVVDHITVFRAELMKHVALMTHRDHRTLSIEDGSYSLEDFVHVCT